MAAEVVEQQICYKAGICWFPSRTSRPNWKEQIDAMQKQHCEDYTVWSEELLRERNEATASCFDPTQHGIYIYIYMDSAEPDAEACKDIAALQEAALLIFIDPAT